jgi:hypothetical protein
MDVRLPSDVGWYMAGQDCRRVLRPESGIEVIFDPRDPIRVGPPMRVVMKSIIVVMSLVPALPLNCGCACP